MNQHIINTLKQIYDKISNAITEQNKKLIYIENIIYIIKNFITTYLF